MTELTTPFFKLFLLLLKGKTSLTSLAPPLSSALFLLLSQPSTQQPEGFFQRSNLIMDDTLQLKTVHLLFGKLLHMVYEITV